MTYKKSLLAIVICIICFPLSICADSAEDSVVVKSKSPSIRQKVAGFFDTSKFKDPDLLDSIMKAKGNDYWKWAAVHRTLDLKDESIHYPKFIKFCIDVYNWGDRTFNTYDSTYVVGTGKNWKVRLKNENWADTYSMRFRNGTDIRMLSNLSCNVGGELAYMAVSVGYMFNMNYAFGGKSINYKKMDFSFTCALFAANFFHSSNTGTTNIWKFGDYNGGKRFKYGFDGLSRSLTELDAYYFFNNKKYSQAAAYCFSKIQKRSAGSAILGLNFSSQEIDLDFSGLPDAMLNQLPDDVREYRFRYNDYCILAGYAYNWVLTRKFLLNLSVLPSIGLRHTLPCSMQGSDDLLSLNMIANMSFVYNHRSLFVGLFGKFNGKFYMNKDYDFFNSFEELNLSAGVRF